MALRRPVGPGAHLELDCWDERTPDDPLDPFGGIHVTVPLLPGHPRLFISATSRATGVVYTALTDAETMRSITVLCDGETIAEKTLAAAPHANAWKLYLVLQDGTLEAGVHGSVATSITLSAEETSADFDVAVGAVDIAPGEPCQIRSIRVGPAFPSLNGS